MERFIAGEYGIVDNLRSSPNLVCKQEQAFIYKKFHKLDPVLFSIIEAYQ